MSQKIQNMFSAISPTYDELNHRLSFGLDKKWRKSACELITCDEGNDLNVLDLCAGTGDFSFEVLKKYPLANVHALDFSKHMLDIALQKSVLHDATKIKFKCADALNLPYDSDFFDVVVCGFGVRNFDDAEKGLTEIHRVLKPGGQVIVLEFFKPTSKTASFFHKTYARYVIPGLGKMVSGHDDAYTYLKNSIQGFMSLKEFEDLLSSTGFTVPHKKDFIFKVASVVKGTK